MFHATTILAYKGKNKAVIGGDGQVVSYSSTVTMLTRLCVSLSGKIVAKT
jgi:ATP-dependent HslUV protease subunit HslV